MEYQLTDNKEAKQYEFHIDGEVPRIEYILAQNQIYLTHTEVPQSLSGKGIGAALVKAALDDIDARGLTLVPLCPFVALYLKRNPEYKRLVMRGINIE